MTILSRYIYSETVRYLIFVLITVLGIYFIVDFFQRLDNFISVDLQTSKIIAYFLFNVPVVIAQVLPICLLLSVIVALGIMNKHNEIVALQSSGVGFFFILRPVLRLGLLITVIVFLLTEVLVPITVPISNRIWMEDIKKKNIVTTREKNIWIKGNRSITHINHYNPIEEKIYGISVYYFNAAFSMVKRLDAKVGEFTDKGWMLEEIMEQTLNPSDGSTKTDLIAQDVRQLELLPEDLVQVNKKSEEMNYRELSQYVQKVEAEGYDALIYKVDLYGKIAFPFFCIIMSLIGAGIGVQRNIKEGLPVGVAYGIGIAFLYWIFYSFTLSLGYGGVIPPMLAVWIPNLVFLSWGAYMGLSN